MIFRGLSNPGMGRALQLLKKQATALAPAPAQDCALCGGPAGRRFVCEPCAMSLPRPGTSCARCAVPLPAPGPCPACRRSPPCFAAAHAVFEYGFPVDRLVAAFKHRGDLAVGDWLGGELAQAAGAWPRPQLLVPAPLAAGRLRARGFNQALELAKAVSARLGVPLARALVAKVRETPPQQALGRAQRRANLRGAFRCAHALDAPHVAVVDDVITTGATADAIAAALKAAGARQVSVWAVARTP